MKTTDPVTPSHFSAESAALLRAAFKMYCLLPAEAFANNEQLLAKRAFQDSVVALRPGQPFMRTILDLGIDLPPTPRPRRQPAEPDVEKDRMEDCEVCDWVRVKNTDPDLPMLLLPSPEQRPPVHAGIEEPPRNQRTLPPWVFRRRLWSDGGTNRVPIWLRVE